MIVKFLINRPVAVIALFLSILALGVYGWVKIPVSLLPDVDPPEISIEVQKSGMGAEVVEQAALSIIRQSVIGSYGLKDVESVATQGFGRVNLTYEFGTNMDLALIEVNEKIDRILSSLPEEMERPIVRKNKPSDIPAIHIHLSSEMISLTNLSQLVKFEITKRFEQLTGVAQIEVNGDLQKSIRLAPKMDKIIAADLNLNTIADLINQANLPINQVLIRDGNYEYLVQVENPLRDEVSLQSLIIPANNGQKIALSDLFEISTSHLNPQNQHIFNGNRGIVLAIYNQPEADLFELQETIFKALDQLKKDFPTIIFLHSQDQIHLLRKNINQLYTTAGLAILFAFIVFFISSASRRLPLILGLVIPSSILISIGMLWMLGFTLNIITLSGFILGIGLLVDNVIILIEEINQKKKDGLSIKEACIVGVKNIFPALLSSTLTTICVFIPLLALGGIASELFKEQAIALIIILGISLLLSFILIPTFYSLWIKAEIKDLKWIARFRSSIHHNSRLLDLSIVILVITIGIYGAITLVPENLPQYSTSDYQAKINWNEPISLSENKRRMEEITGGMKTSFIAANLGISGISSNETPFFNEANLYINTKKSSDLDSGQLHLKKRCEQLYPKATFSLQKAVNPFEMIFYNTSPLAEARIRKADGSFFDNEDLIELEALEKDGAIKAELAETYKILFKKDRINNSSLDYPFLVSHLKNLTDEKLITSIKKPDQSIPITLSNDDFTYFIKKDSGYLDLAYFYEIKDTVEMREITADISGPFISYTSYSLEEVRSFGKKTSTLFGWVYDLEGQLLESKKNLNRLLFASILGIVLLYLILAAQFESFKQPLIIFSVIPLALLGSLGCLSVTGSTLNIMSIIGLIVMLGIIVNDSILKIDAINRNIKNGLSKNEAILKAKNERFKPILMTSLSTIFALTPILFSTGISSDLQEPLAIAVISGLVIGTWSSISLLPAIYSKLVLRS